jgi:hypothetical protein
MPVTWFIFPDRARAKLILSDPYTFTEWQDAMLAILAADLRKDFRILLDRRSGSRFTNSFVSSAMKFFETHEAALAGTRLAILVDPNVSTLLPNLRIGRFHLRAFHDAAGAEEWLHPLPG